MLLKLAATKYDATIATVLATLPMNIKKDDGKGESLDKKEAKNMEKENKKETGEDIKATQTIDLMCALHNRHSCKYSRSRLHWRSAGHLCQY